MLFRSQTIYLGTPPDENCIGTVFRKIRERAKNGESDSTAWTEYSVEDIGDVTDRQRWAACNPALGRRITESTIAAECEQMDTDTFARERLGWWSPIIEDRLDYAIDNRAWEACASALPKPEGKTAYGVKFTADGSSVCLAGAVIPKNGKIRISLIQEMSTSQGIAWLADWLNARADKAACVVIDGRNGVDLLIDKIVPYWKYKNSVVRPKASDVIAAASLLINNINEKTLDWYELQEELSRSATTAIKRPISGGFGFGGEYSAPIEACSLALWGATNTKRDPSKKMRIG